MLPNPDGDAKRIHGGLSWFGQRRPYVQRGGRVLYFLAPRCLRRGYKLRERELVPSLRKGKNEELLEVLILKSSVSSPGEFFTLPFYRLKRRV
jgi:hypothetical protein